MKMVIGTLIFLNLKQPANYWKWNCRYRTGYFWHSHLFFFLHNIKCLHSWPKGDFRNHIAFLLLTDKLSLSHKQQWQENRSLIATTSACARLSVHTNLYCHLIHSIIPSRGTRLSWQQTMQRLQVCCVTFFMSFHQKSPGICALRPAPHALSQQRETHGAGNRANGQLQRTPFGKQL